jgi:ankyrin repeat protein
VPLVCCTPLFVAIIQGHCHVVDALLHGGANVNKTDDRGVTPLFIASFKGLVDVVEVLLRVSADVNIATNDGITPLWIASEQGYYDIVEALLRGGADVNIVSTDGTTPLYNASIKGYSNIVDTLLSGGADVNRANGRGITPLNAASFKGHCGVVELLLLARADLNSASDGLTPLLSATKNGHTDVINVLQLASAAEKVRSRMTESVQQSQTGASKNSGGASVPYGDLSHSSAAICIDQSTAVAVANPLSVLTAEAAYARDMHFALRIISADFPRFELGKKVPNCHKSKYWVTIWQCIKALHGFRQFRLRHQLPAFLLQGVPAQLVC